MLKIPRKYSTKITGGIVCVSVEMGWPCFAVTGACLSSLFASCSSCCRHLPGDGTSVISALIDLLYLFLSDACVPVAAARTTQHKQPFGKCPLEIPILKHNFIKLNVTL